MKLSTNFISVALAIIARVRSTTIDPNTDSVNRGARDIASNIYLESGSANYEAVRQSCQPGHYKCAGEGIYVCDNLEQLVLTDICPMECCKEYSNGVAYCYCRGSPDAESRGEKKSNACDQPGAYSCADDGSLMMCSVDRELRVSAHCGSSDGCKEGEKGVAYCDLPKRSEGIEARGNAI